MDAAGHFASGAAGSQDADWFGSAVALAGDFALVGARASDVAAPSAGAVFVYGPGVPTASEPVEPARPEALRVWPNPASTVLHVQGGSADANAEVVVLDVLGRVVRRVRLGRTAGTATMDTATVDVSGLAPGIYVVRAGTEAGVVTVRR